MENPKQEPKRIVLDKKTVDALLLRTGVTAGMLSGGSGGGGPGSLPHEPPKLPDSSGM